MDRYPTKQPRTIKIDIFIGDSRKVLSQLPPNSIHTCVTSPPYWKTRHYFSNKEVGQESLLDDYVSSLTGIFDRVARVLRPDGTLWLNLGDVYYAKGWECARRNVLGQGSMKPSKRRSGKRAPGLKRKDLVGLPWRVAFALQANGWYLRRDIIWNKTNPGSESVRDRPTGCHEYVFLFSRRPRYFFDQEAVKQPLAPVSIERIRRMTLEGLSPTRAKSLEKKLKAAEKAGLCVELGGRNIRSVWTIPCSCYRGEHTSVYPEQLVEPCIKAGTGQDGCCPCCGAVRLRKFEIVGNRKDRGSATSSYVQRLGDTKYKASAHTKIRITTGWKPGCKHKRAPTPCTVLDCFAGAGTTGLVAAKLGRNAILIELNPASAKEAAKRIRKAAPNAVVKIHPPSGKQRKT